MMMNTQYLKRMVSTITADELAFAEMVSAPAASQTTHTVVIIVYIHPIFVGRYIRLDLGLLPLFITAIACGN